MPSWVKNKATIVKSMLYFVSNCCFILYTASQIMYDAGNKETAQVLAMKLIEVTNLKLCQTT